MVGHLSRASIEGRRRKLSAEKQQLLEKQLRGSGSKAAQQIRSQKFDGPVPLSPSQERLWLLEQIEDLGSTYTIAAAVRLHGVLDDAALERSFAALIARHESLRTRFESVDGVAVQVIDAAGGFALERLDLTEEEEARREVEARHRLGSIARERFDLARGPLVRVVLAKLGTDDHVALMMMHHIVSDGWSLGVLARISQTRGVHRG